MGNRYSELIQKIEFGDDFNQTTSRKMLDAIAKTGQSGRILARTSAKSKVVLWFRAGTAAAVACLLFLLLYWLQPQLFEANLPVATTHQPTVTTPVSSSSEREMVIIHSFDIGQNLLTGAALHAAMCSTLSMEMPRADGATLFSDSLRAAIQKYQGSNTFCTVWIFLNIDRENATKAYSYSTFQYKGLTISEWKPLYLNVLRDLDAWKRDQWIGLYGKENEDNNYDKWLGLEENSLAIDENWNKEYQQIWQADNPGQDYPVSSYLEAISRRDNGAQEAIEALYEHCLRDLSSCGLALSPVEDQNDVYAATLSIQQLQELPQIEGIKGYSVMFADEENCSFGGKYLSSTLNIPEHSVEYIILHMTDTDKFETNISLYGYSQAQFDEAFKQAYPDSYRIAHEWDLSDKNTPCPNPGEVDKAIRVRQDFAQYFFSRKINDFLEKYEISDEDIIILGYGNATESPGLMIWANRDLLIRLLGDSEIKRIYFAGGMSAAGMR